MVFLFLAIQTKGFIRQILIGHPQKIVIHDNVMQALLPQEIEIKTTVFSVAYATTLVALSNDNGKKWYFVDANLYKMADVKKMLPMLSTALTLPATKPPKMTPNKAEKNPL